MNKLPSRQKAKPSQVKRLKYNEEESDNMSTLHVVMTISYFAALFIILFYYPKTFVSLSELFVHLLLVLALTCLIPITFYRKKLTMSFYEYYIMNFISLTPTLYALFLLLNYHINTASYIEEHLIINKQRVGRNFELTLENNAYTEEEFVRLISIKDEFKIETYSFNLLKLHIADGIFGIRVLKEREFLEVNNK